MVIHLKFLQRSNYRERNECGQCVITAGKQKRAQNIGLQAFLQKLVVMGALARCILAADDSLGQLGKNQGFQPGSNFWSILLSLALISILSSVLSKCLLYILCLFLKMIYLFGREKSHSIVHIVLGVILSLFSQPHKLHLACTTCLHNFL